MNGLIVTNSSKSLPLTVEAISSANLLTFILIFMQYPSIIYEMKRQYCDGSHPSSLQQGLTPRGLAESGVAVGKMDYTMFLMSYVA